LIFAIWFIDTFTGYIALRDGLLTRKTLFSTKSIKVNDIGEVNISGSGVFPTSGLGAGIIYFGNAKDGNVGINPVAFKKKELTPLIKQLYSELQSVNSKRAKNLQKAFSHYFPDLQ
jgi:hypothetical protein